ncbi:MAG: ATP-binding protein [Alphaproteobacteria bacterium]|nr:ATP-binding protein [Alphaproteobacteria bacterium]
MKRDAFINEINQLFRVHPAIALLGPRQCGKTTLAQMYAETHQPTKRFDLENPEDLVLLENPMLALSELEGLVILDEIQRRPDLFPVLRVLIDRHKENQKFLILGSASRDLIRQSSETLAGRLAHIEVTPFSYWETGEINKLWVRGGFPLAYLAPSEVDTFNWLKFYIISFLERDIPSLGINVPAATLRRFWMMLAHYHGNIFNASEIGKSLSASTTAIRHYIDILVGTFMIRQLQPWVENIKKRQVKTPKIYFRDSGVFHSLLGIKSQEDLFHHPKMGASWEGFALEEIIRFHQADPEDCFFWAVHSQAELDLLIVKGGKKIGFEIKYTDAPKITKSMHVALETLDLDSLTVIYPGNQSFALSEKIRVANLEGYLKGTLSS